MKPLKINATLYVSEILRICVNHIPIFLRNYPHNPKIHRKEKYYSHFIFVYLWILLFVIYH